MESVIENKPLKRWQNLIHKKCPRCDERMNWRDKYFRCPSGCFTISGVKLIEILTDPEHIVQQYLSPHEREIIEGGIKKVMSEV